MPAPFGPIRQPADPAGPWIQAKRRLAKSHVAMASTFGFLVYVYVGLLAQAGMPLAWRGAIAPSSTSSCSATSWSRPRSRR
jgi:hypothetical protein